MDTSRRRKEIQNRRFAREELGELLRLFSSLGITVAAGITAFFLFGLWADRALAERGIVTYGIPRVLFVLGGVALTLYWAYLRIARHIEKFAPAPRREKDAAEKTPSNDT